MNIFRELAKKPWTEPGTAEDGPGGEVFFLPAEKVGLRIFLVVVTIVFSLMIVLYADRFSLPNWHPLSEPYLLWLNTAVLILSSIALQWARRGAARGNIDDVKNGMLAGGILSFAFLAGQLVAWSQLVDLGYFASTDTAAAYFYLFTAAHGVHLLGGLVAWGRTTAKLRRGYDVEQVRLSVELCTAYWHYLLVVWLVLFALLLLT